MISTVVSIISAVVAVSSALLAHRAKVQTRSDLFEGQRDALLLLMADNDIRCEHLNLQCAIARDELEQILPLLPSKSDIAEANKLLGKIMNIENVTRSMDAREYNEERLDALVYNEGSLNTLRRMARGEQLIAKQLSPASYDLVFKYIEKFVAKYAKR